ncbi:exported hypothetical protein [Candidatus Nitrospira nitrosa]|uniref:Uncharacterized protein n=1 Tax=Candidatus Nitrospira nitrosa TaxID=1742972 RepID=A0A0S4L7S2_9BACT|nr:hypothetical protein [Candidatus Nitrospira nitrosa]CUS32664.1 exported hypothetical protein [Candidatus Nitrospira nitrosa]
MLTLTRYTLPVLMFLLFNATANVSPAQVILRSRPPSLHSYAVTSIQAILSDPRHYQFRIVRIRGVVQSITQVPNWIKCGFAPAHKIRVEDESGGLTVIDQGPCARNSRNSGSLLPETLVGGEQIDALIFVSFTNHPWESPNPPEGLIQELERFQ